MPVVVSVVGDYHCTFNIDGTVRVMQKGVEKTVAWRCRYSSRGASLEVANEDGDVVFSVEDDWAAVFDGNDGTVLRTLLDRVVHGVTELLSLDVQSAVISANTLLGCGVVADRKIGRYLTWNDTLLPTTACKVFEDPEFKIPADDVRKKRYKPVIQEDGSVIVWDTHRDEAYGILFPRYLQQNFTTDIGIRVLQGVGGESVLTSSSTNSSVNDNEERIMVGDENFIINAESGRCLVPGTERCFENSVGDACIKVETRPLPGTRDTASYNTMRWRSLPYLGSTSVTPQSEEERGYRLQNAAFEGESGMLDTNNGGVDFVYLNDGSPAGTQWHMVSPGVQSVGTQELLTFALRSGPTGKYLCEPSDGEVKVLPAPSEGLSRKFHWRVMP